MSNDGWPVFAVLLSCLLLEHFRQNGIEWLNMKCPISTKYTAAVQACEHIENKDGLLTYLIDRLFDFRSQLRFDAVFTFETTHSNTCRPHMHSKCTVYSKQSHIHKPLTQTHTHTHAQSERVVKTEIVRQSACACVQSLCFVCNSTRTHLSYTHAHSYFWQFKPNDVNNFYGLSTLCSYC